MSKLIKRCCIALLAGTALSMNMDVQGAKADPLDDAVNNAINWCFKESQLRQLNYQEFQACNRIIQLKQQSDYNNQMRNYQSDIFRQTLEDMQRIYESESPIITPVPLGLPSE